MAMVSSGQGVILGVGCSILVIGLAARVVIPKLLMRRKLGKFSSKNCPKDVIILHGTRRTASIPSASPFVLKLETFLRIAKLPYEYDGNLSNSLGPLGKTPWISLNGEHMGDSQVCIDFLQRKFNHPIKHNYSNKQLAVARIVRTALEDKIYWELLLWAFVWPGEGSKIVQKFLSFPWLLVKYFNRHYAHLAWAHGVGRHEKTVVQAWLMEDMKAISDVLGENKYLLGDQVCTEDACLFGFLAQLLWGYQSLSNHAKVIRERHPNLESYCWRMKQEFFPDWTQLLSK